MATDEHVHILLIEDSATSVEMVRIWLDAGLPTSHTLHTAGALRNGIDRFDSEPVDLIILDLNLPDSEGLSTFAALRAHAPDTPIVIMSSESDEELAVRAVRLGAQDYVVKGTFAENPLARPVRYALERVRRENAEKALRRTQQQIFLAEAVQQQLFPSVSPSISGFDVAGRCEPAESTGGDYFDWFPMIGSKHGAVIGDVSGHGLDACLLMVAARASLRALVTAYSDVGFILNRMNQLLDNDLALGRFVTLMLVCIDPATRSFRYAAAGHHAVLLDANGRQRLRLKSEEPPLGVDIETAFQTSGMIRIEPGESIVMFTDGVTERMRANSEDYGEARLLDLIRTNYQSSADDLVNLIFENQKVFAGSHAQLDDITVVVVKCAGEAGGENEGFVKDKT